MSVNRHKRRTSKEGTFDASDITERRKLHWMDLTYGVKGELGYAEVTAYVPKCIWDRYRQIQVDETVRTRALSVTAVQHCVNTLLSTRNKVPIQRNWMTGEFWDLLKIMIKEWISLARFSID